MRSANFPFVSRARSVTREVVAVAVVQAVVLTTLAAILPTWQDEEFTMTTTAHGIAYAIHRALTYELQAPLYFAILAGLRKINGSVFFAREFSVATQVATTFVCAWIARRIWPERSTWMFCALVAVNWFSMFAGLEIRTYSLALLQEAALLAFAIAGFLLGTDTRARLAFVLCAILGLYTQYFIAFEIAAIFVAILVLGRFRALPAYLGSVAVALVAFAPLALYVRTQANDTLSVETTGPQGFGGMFLHPANVVLVHVFSESHAGKILWIALFAVLVAAVLLGRPRLDVRKWALVSLFVVVDLIYASLSDIAKLNLVFPRHYIALFIPQIVLAYAIAAGFTGRFRSQAAVAVAIVFALTNLITDVQTYGTGAKFGDSARVGALLTNHAKVGDAIAVFPGDAAPSVQRYYHGALPIEGYPVPLDERVYHVDAALVRSAAEANAALDRLPHGRRLWFDTVGYCTASDVHGCFEVESAIAKRFRVVGKYVYFQAVVFELEPIATR